MVDLRAGKFAIGVYRFAAGGGLTVGGVFEMAIDVGSVERATGAGAGLIEIKGDSGNGAEITSGFNSAVGGRTVAVRAAWLVSGGASVIGKAFGSLPS